MVQRAMKFTPEVLLSAPRRSPGVPNASGTKVLFTTSTYSFKNHAKTTELRVLDLATDESYLLAKDDDISDMNWLNDDEFACLQVEKDGSTSIFVASVEQVVKQPSLGESHYRAGTIKAGAGNLKVVPVDAKGDEFAVVFSAKASPDGSLYSNDKATTEARSTGRLYNGLFVRHWDHWVAKEKNALWFGKLSRGVRGKFDLSKLTNALGKTGLECPIEPFGGADNFDVRKDAIIFVAKNPKVDPALNTSENIYLLHIDSWAQDHAPILEMIPIEGWNGAKSCPVFSSDGVKAAFLGMKKDGYESDRNDVFVIIDVGVAKAGGERKVEQLITNNSKEKGWDRSPSSIVFSADGNSLLMVAEEEGAAKVFKNDINPPHQGPPLSLTNRGYVIDIKPLKDGRAFMSGTTLVDNSFYSVIKTDGTSTSSNTWQHSNSADGSKFGLKGSQTSSIWTPASNPKINEKVQSIVMKPSNFEEGKKYPVAYLIHGGPQGSWADNWSTRWNPAVFAEQGYIVIAPNPTGSTGYGQAFTDAINQNYGQDPYQDIVNAFEWVGKNMKEADNDRAVALGASYGGYMINWIQGHDLGRKFKALVCHDGIFSMAGMLATEELFFPFNDLGGTPWYSPPEAKQDPTNVASQAHRNFGSTTFSSWRRFDPSEHLSNWCTPQLVIHSSKDYRLPIGEGLAAFNVLQARGVESQFLTFPDENHWVLKPENSLVWHKVVLNWCNKFVGLEPCTTEDPVGEEFWGGVREKEEEQDKGNENMPMQGKPET